MEIKTLGFVKKEVTDDECVYNFGLAEWPMIFSAKMKYEPRISARNTRFEADVSFWSFCWENTSNPVNHVTHISESIGPCCFIVSKIEKILEIDLKGKRPYVTYETTLSGEKFKMTLCYPHRQKGDKPITDTFSQGDTIIGLFKAEVKNIN